MRLLFILLFPIVFNAQSIILNDSTICIPNKQMDGLIEDNLRAKRLVIDTANKAERIKGLLLSNQKQLSIIRNQDRDIQENVKLANGYKKDYEEVNLKFNKIEKKLDRRNAQCVILIGVSTILGALMFVK